MRSDGCGVGSAAFALKGSNSPIRKRGSRGAFADHEPRCAAARGGRRRLRGRHRPYVNAVARELPQAEIVFDKFHALQHASAALDTVRRQAFFRAGAVMRA